MFGDLMKNHQIAILSLALLAILSPGAPLAGQSEEAPPAHRQHEQHGRAEHQGDDEKLAGAHQSASGAHSGSGFHHDFSDVERWQARFDNPARDEWQRPSHVVELLQISPGMTVVDLGAGTGYFMSYLSQAVGKEGQVLALDVEPTMVEHLQGRAAEAGFDNVEARHIPFDDTQLTAGSSDRILIVDTWHHIDARSVYSAGLAKALSAEGRVYIVDFTSDSPEGPPVEHRLTPEQVMRELEDGGLRAELVQEDLPWQFVVMAQR